MKIENIETVQLIPVSDLSELNQTQIIGAVATYQGMFAKTPYQETLTDEGALGALQYILDKGVNVVIGQAEGAAISLAGGYIKDRNVYCIEELAGNSDRQGQGIGRLAPRVLIDRALLREPTGLEIRAATRHYRALSLDGSEGFVSESVSEVGSSKARQKTSA